MVVCIAVAITTIGCDQQLGVGKSSIEMSDVALRSQTENPTNICIGCGCHAAWKACKEGGATHSCWDPFAQEIDIECCKEQRANCHECSSGVICVHWNFIADTSIAGFYQIDLPLIEEDSILLIPYEIQIDKFINEVPLTEADFDTLDMDLID